MGLAWRAVALLLLTAAAVAAFVPQNALRWTSSATNSCGAVGRVLRAARDAAPTAAEGRRRAVPVALAPGTKVGKSKVSLGRAIPQIAQPKTEAAQATKAAAAKPKQKQQTEEEEVPMFKVILLGDEGYERAHVVMSLQEIVPDTDNVRAAEIYDEAQTTGKGLCGIYPEEHAELYVQQLTRAEPMIFADLEPE